MYYWFRNVHEYILFLKEICESKISPESLLTTHQQYLAQFNLGEPASEEYDLCKMPISGTQIFSYEGAVGVGADISNLELLYTAPGVNGAFRHKLLNRSHYAVHYPNAKIPPLEEFKPSQVEIKLPPGMIFAKHITTDEHRPYPISRVLDPIVWHLHWGRSIENG